MTIGRIHITKYLLSFRDHVYFCLLFGNDMKSQMSWEVFGSRQIRNPKHQIVKGTASRHEIKRLFFTCSLVIN